MNRNDSAAAVSWQHLRVLFGDIALARRVEAAERDLVAAAGEAASKRQPDALVRAVAGGVAVFVEPGAPWNKLAGLGFEGAPSLDELGVIETEFARRGAPLQVELSTLADPAIGPLLTSRGYRLLGFEHVLGRTLSAVAPAPRSTDVDVALLSEGEDPQWLGTMITAFEHADTQGVASHESFPRGVLERAMNDLSSIPGFRGYLARRQGDVAGGASLRVESGVAIFCGAATLPSHRRRGVQTQMLEARLGDAANAGCDLAVVTTQPGSKSQENVMRRGFSLLYARAHLVRDPSGPFG